MRLLHFCFSPTVLRLSAGELDVRTSLYQRCPLDVNRVERVVEEQYVGDIKLHHGFLSEKEEVRGVARQEQEQEKAGNDRQQMLLAIEGRHESLRDTKLKKGSLQQMHYIL